jgi:hypothetical protein
MPLNSRQLADLVNRAKLRPPPVVSPPQPPPPPQRSVRPRQVTPAPQAAAATRPPPSTPKTLTLRPKAAAAAPTAPLPPPLPSPAPQAEHVAAAEDFPVGWQLHKESWYFHRRFYAVLRRPMAPGEYSHLLKQIRRRQAERLGEDCWRVTLPDGKRTLVVRGYAQRLLTILPKNWQPPARRPILPPLVGGASPCPTIVP